MDAKRSHKKKTAAPPEELIHTVHRVTDHGPHRIEIHTPDKPPEIGEWAEDYDIARLHHFRAVTGKFAATFPPFFKIVPVKHRYVPDGTLNSVSVNISKSE